MNITIDDRSPQLLFISQQPFSAAQPGWIDDHNGGMYPDTFTNSYYDDTFTATFEVGNFMQFFFNGTAVYVYGSKRFNHGMYSAQLDGGELVTQNGYAPGNAQFQQLLYYAEGLSNSTGHVLTMTNAANTTTNPNLTWFDIDYIILTADPDTNSSTSTNPSASTEQIYTTYFDDTSPACTYTGSWSLGPPLQPQTYYNQTAHITGEIGDTMTLAFNGSSVELFGGMYYDHGNYTISIDGVPRNRSFNGTFFQLEVRTSLFVATGLEDGPHTITLRNDAKGPIGSFLDFDYAVVNSTIQPSTSGSSNGTGTVSNSTTVGAGSGSSPTSMSSSTPGLTESHSNAGAIAGGVVGGLVGLALIGFLLWFFLFRRRRDRTSPLLGEKTTRTIDLNGDEVAPYQSPSLGTANSSLMGHSPMSPEHTALANGPSVGVGPGLNVPPPPGSSHASYPRSYAAPSTAGGTQLVINEEDLGYPYYNPFTASTSPPSAGGASPGGMGGGSASGESSGSDGGPRTIFQAQSSAKTAGATLPYTARTSPNAVSRGSQPSVDRMQVAGRAQDAGPVELPPNYEQATEPLPGQSPPRPPTAAAKVALEQSLAERA